MVTCCQDGLPAAMVLSERQVCDDHGKATCWSRGRVFASNLGLISKGPGRGRVATSLLLS